MGFEIDEDDLPEFLHKQYLLDQIKMEDERPSKYGVNVSHHYADFDITEAVVDWQIAGADSADLVIQPYYWTNGYSTLLEHEFELSQRFIAADDVSDPTPAHYPQIILWSSSNPPATDHEPFVVVDEGFDHWTHPGREQVTAETLCHRRQNESEEWVADVIVTAIDFDGCAPPTRFYTKGPSGGWPVGKVVHAYSLDGTRLTDQGGLAVSPANDCNPRDIDETCGCADTPGTYVENW